MEKNHLPEGIQLRILPYAHCDLAALHTRAWHKARYQQIFDAVAELAEKMPEFRRYFDCYRSQLEFLFDKYPEKKICSNAFCFPDKWNLSAPMQTFARIWWAKKPICAIFL